MAPRISNGVRRVAAKMKKPIVVKDDDWGGDESPTRVDIERRMSIPARAARNWNHTTRPVQIAAVTALIAAITPIILGIIELFKK